MRTIIVLIGVVVAMAATIVPASASREDYFWLDDIRPSAEQSCDCSRPAPAHPNARPAGEERSPAGTAQLDDSFNF